MSLVTILEADVLPVILVAAATVGVYAWFQSNHNSSLKYPIPGTSPQQYESLATELACQGLLTDYNTAFDQATTNIQKDSINHSYLRVFQDRGCVFASPIAESSYNSACSVYQCPRFVYATPECYNFIGPLMQAAGTLAQDEADEFCSDAAIYSGDPNRNGHISCFYTGDENYTRESIEAINIARDAAHLPPLGKDVTACCAAINARDPSAVTSCASSCQLIPKKDRSLVSMYI